jgi:hypothetical protein
MKPLILALLGLLCASPAQGFRRIASLESVVEVVKDMDPRETLVVLDLHETLAESGSAAGVGTAVFMEELKARGILPVDRFAVWEEVHKTTPLAPMEPRTAEWVKKLQERVPTMVLTAAPPHLMNRFHEQLGELGIQMSAHLGAFSGQQLLSVGAANMLMKDGILAKGDGCTKGEALKMLFVKRRAFPRNLIFVDNQHHHLEDVGKMRFRYGNVAANVELFQFRGRRKQKSLDWQLALAELQAAVALDSQSALLHCRRLVSFFGEQ